MTPPPPADRDDDIESDRDDDLEAAARFVAEEPGRIDRALDQHVRRDNGDCAGCGTYRSVRWPCVLVYIANRAAEIVRERTPRALRPPTPAGGRRRTDPAASRSAPGPGC